MVSTWHSNRYRSNEYLQNLWKNYNLVTTEHFYHLGGKEENRNAVTEALILNFENINSPKVEEHPSFLQLEMF